MPPATARRTEDAHRQIADAVIAVVAEVGVSRLTHRRVAASAGVSLSATTYYYDTKGDMLADAAQRLLDGYLDDFRALARECRDAQRAPFTMAELCFRIVRNAAARNRESALAWCEIMLDAARTPEGHAIALRWYADLQDAWAEVADAIGEPSAPLRLNGMIDLIVGLLFVSRGLGLDRAQIEAVEQGASPTGAWNLAALAAGAGAGVRTRRSRKSAETHERLLQAAIGLLIGQGAGAVGYATVAEAGGEAKTAPAYHFGSIAGLLKAAEARMLRDANARWRDAFGGAGHASRSAEELADVTAAIFVREATQFRTEAIAHYSIWLEAARDPQLLPDVAAAVRDQIDAWMLRLAPLSGASEHNALACYAEFVGALIRAISTGGGVETLAGARGRFVELFAAVGADPDNGTLFQNLLTPRSGRE